MNLNLFEAAASEIRAEVSIPIRDLMNLNPSLVEDF